MKHIRFRGKTLILFSDQDSMLNYPKLLAAPLATSFQALYLPYALKSQTSATNVLPNLTKNFKDRTISLVLYTSLRMPTFEFYGLLPIESCRGR